MRKTTVSTTTLTEKGFWGAILFVGGPTVAGVLCANIFRLSVVGGFGTEDAILGSTLGMAACGFAGLLGFVLLLTGRTTVTELRVVETPNKVNPEQSSVPLFGGSEKERAALGLDR